MKISVLTIGDELLTGATINTNAASLGESLVGCGCSPAMAMTVADRAEDIARALDFLLPQSQIIICSGGLGSTGDDVTCQSVADYFGLPLVEDAETAAKLRRRLESGHVRCAPEKLLRQAMIPAGAEALLNSHGTAPGIWLKLPDADKYLCLLPGPPHEQRPMVAGELLPRLTGIMGDKSCSRVYRIAFASELWVEEITAGILRDTPAVSPAYCAAADHVRLFLRSNDEVALLKKATEIEMAFGARIIRPECHSLAEEMVALLRERHLQLATAESCTGGMIAAAITDIPGSSAIFRGSVIAYSDAIKHDVLGVSSTVLEAYGSVSGQCVSSMVENLCVKLHAEAGVAVSGIAGPGGGTVAKPVGLVFVAAKLGQKAVVKQYNFPGNRDAVRRSTVAAALFELRCLMLDV